MTYQETLKARARIAYGFNLNKRAVEEPYDDAKHPAQTPAEIFASQERNAEEGKA